MSAKTIEVCGKCLKRLIDVKVIINVIKVPGNCYICDTPHAGINKIYGSAALDYLRRRNKLNQFTTGRVVQSKATGVTYIITDNYWERVTAVRTVDITNPDEWELQPIRS